MKVLVFRKSSVLPHSCSCSVHGATAALLFLREKCLYVKCYYLQRRSKHIYKRLKKKLKKKKNVIYYVKKNNIYIYIYYDKTQHANFRGNPPFQATKQRLNNSRNGDK